MDAFTVLAAPARRRIVETLHRAPSSVNDLAARIGETQPTVSKHLKVLRGEGFVSCRGAAQQRIYSLEPGPFRALDRWLEPYRQLWSRHLDALEHFLDTQEAGDETKRLSTRQSRPRRSAAGNGAERSHSGPRGRRRARNARVRS